MVSGGRPLSTGQKWVLGAAFVPMVVTGGAGAYGTYSNMSAVYGDGTAAGAVAAGEGATAVLALVLLGLTMLGQSSPLVIRAGLWALPAAASVMSATAASSDRIVVYALTPLGMTAAAEGAAFLARRIVVHRDGRDAEAEARTAAVVQSLAFHRARAANHPDEKTRNQSERASWRLAKKVGIGDVSLGTRLVGVQRERVTAGADAALTDMFTVTRAVTPTVTAEPVGVLETPQRAALEPARDGLRDGQDTQVSTPEPDAEPVPVTPVTVPAVTPVTEPVTDTDDEPVQAPAEPPVTLAELAAVTGVTAPEPSVPLTDTQLAVVLRFLRYSADPPLSYRQAAAAFREQGYVGAEARVRAAWGALMSQEETAG
ncbi:hypothetical protein [Streptomyces sp. NPDC048659]|uniref:hypothetical protein n=1 Tax=Streptomyces sp. NPDC048659 TaxID=3155489 RepID=UPI003439F932